MHCIHHTRAVLSNVLALIACCSKYLCIFFTQATLVDLSTAGNTECHRNANHISMSCFLVAYIITFVTIVTLNVRSLQCKHHSDSEWFRFHQYIQYIVTLSWGIVIAWKCLYQTSTSKYMITYISVLKHRNTTRYMHMTKKERSVQFQERGTTRMYMLQPAEKLLLH